MTQQKLSPSNVETDGDKSALLPPDEETQTKGTTVVAKKAEQELTAEQELERVRELIMEPDVAPQQLGKAEVDRLRRIMFGAQLEEYERRFTDTRREMERVVTELRTAQDHMSEFEKAQTRRLEALNQELHGANDQLRRETEFLREQLRARETLLQQLLNQTRQQETINQSLSTGTKELNQLLSQQTRDFRTIKTTIDDHRDQFERKLEALKRDTRQVEDNLRDELRHIADHLDNQKIDSKSLAAMLMEVAARLETGNSMSGLLKGLTTSSQE